LSDFSRIFDLRRDSRDTRRILRALFLCAALLVLSAISASRTLNAGAIHTAASASPGLTVAIADFDGDHHLDQASIEIGRSASGDSTYWIQFYCSTTGRHFISLVAPEGGLQIEARDVNGDHHVDLVFTTAWFRQPVAVLLNDGHGRFLRAEPDAFPSAFSQTKTIWIAAPSAPADVAGLPPQSTSGVNAAAERPLHSRSHTNLALPASPDPQQDPFVFLSAGRAPPTQSSHL
jgi:hypothetical protein